MAATISPYLGKYATNKITGATVKVRYDNNSGGLYVEFCSGPMIDRRTWFRSDDLEDYREAP